MGAGNWYPDGHDENRADYVYIDITEEADPNDALAEALEILRIELPESFYLSKNAALCGMRDGIPSDIVGKDETAFMMNHFMSVNTAWNGDTPVIVFRYHDKADGEPDLRGKPTARRCVRVLMERFELRVRCGPWTSCRVEYPSDVTGGVRRGL